MRATTREPVLREVAGLVLVTAISCGTTEPTYRDVPRAQIEAIAAQWELTLNGLFLTHRARLRKELSDEWGMTVTRLYEDENADGVVDDPVVARITPATRDAIGTGLDQVDDPSSTSDWIGAGLAGGGILLAGILGLRGRNRRRREVEDGEVKTA